MGNGRTEFSAIGRKVGRAARITNTFRPDRNIEHRCSCMPTQLHSSSHTAGLSPRSLGDYRNQIDQGARVTAIDPRDVVVNLGSGNCCSSPPQRTAGTDVVKPLRDGSKLQLVAVNKARNGRSLHAFPDSRESKCRNRPAWS